MKTTLEIQNLKCGGCQNTIKKRLGNLQFVKNLDVEAGVNQRDLPVNLWSIEDGHLPDCEVDCEVGVLCQEPGKVSLM